jgi:hypothetical protein
MACAAPFGNTLWAYSPVIISVPVRHSGHPFFFVLIQKSTLSPAFICLPPFFKLSKLRKPDMPGVILRCADGYNYRECRNNHGGDSYRLGPARRIARGMVNR